MELTVLNKQLLKNIPSASGIEIVDDAVYVIGDNSPWVFTLDKEYKITHKLPIASLNGLIDNQIPKTEKPDFEAIACVKTGKNKKLLIFGSGSKSPQRDIMVEIDLDNQEHIKTHSLEKLYEKIRVAAKLDKTELNIEAAIASSEKLYFFNRGKNKVLSFNLNAFLEHINNKGNCPEPEVFHFKLPEINGIEAGFSGAAITPDENKIVFTSSVENTANWIDDGPILGSFVGIINLKNPENDLTASCAKLMDNGKTFTTKVESVAVYHTVKNTLHLLLVTDDDKGQSELIEATLNLN